MRSKTTSYAVTGPVSSSAQAPGPVLQRADADVAADPRLDALHGRAETLETVVMHGMSAPTEAVRIS